MILKLCISQLGNGKFCLISTMTFCYNWGYGEWAQFGRLPDEPQLSPEESHKQNWNGKPILFDSRCQCPVNINGTPCWVQMIRSQCALPISLFLCHERHWKYHVLLRWQSSKTKATQSPGTRMTNFRKTGSQACTLARQVHMSLEEQRQLCK